MPVSNRADLIQAWLDVANEDRRELRDRLAAALWELRRVRAERDEYLQKSVAATSALERLREKRRLELEAMQGEPQNSTWGDESIGLFAALSNKR